MIEILKYRFYFSNNILGDKIGRRFTQALTFVLAMFICIPIMFLVQNPDYSVITSILAVMIKFNIAVNFFAINLQAMEIYPTCLRQTGFSIMTVVANTMGLLGPYIVYLVSTNPSSVFSSVIWNNAYFRGRTMTFAGRTSLCPAWLW